MKYFHEYKIYVLIGLVVVTVSGSFFSHRQVKKETALPTIHMVSLSNHKADPNELVIKVGEKIQFNTKDQSIHNIAPGKGNDYGQVHDHVGVGTTTESGNFGAGEAYLASFNKAGTYYFHDDRDPDIFITVLVY